MDGGRDKTWLGEDEAGLEAAYGPAAKQQGGPSRAAAVDEPASNSLLHVACWLYVLGYDTTLTAAAWESARPCMPSIGRLLPICCLLIRPVTRLQVLHVRRTYRWHQYIWRLTHRVSPSAPPQPLHIPVLVWLQGDLLSCRICLRPEPESLLPPDHLQAAARMPDLRARQSWQRQGLARQ